MSDVTVLSGEVPRVAASAGSLIRDAAGNILILKPSYKKSWTIPGGQIEPDDESPWDACRRETLEECGLRIEKARLACVDFLLAKPSRPGGIRFLFDCGTFTDEQLAEIAIDGVEILEHRLADPEEAATLLSKPLRRRVRAALTNTHTVYLERGQLVSGVGA